MITLPENQSYTPAEHLISGSVFTSEQLVAQFEVANLNNSFNTVLESERQKFAGALDGLEKELAELKLLGVKTPRQPSGVSLESEVQKTPHSTKPKRPNPIIGVFHTKELRPWTQVRHKTSKTVFFSRPYVQPPCIPVGLTAVDTDYHINPRVTSFANNIHNDRFEINIDSWADTKLYLAGCAWLEIEADDPDFQVGIYNTVEDHSWRSPQTHNTRKVTFPRAYDSAPVVVVWLTTVDMDYNRNWRVRTFATDVTATGFTIHIDTWSDSILYTAKATWVAYPPGKPGVYSGRFSALDLRPPKNPQLYNSGYEKFGGGVFDVSPRTLLAIDSFDIGHVHNMRLNVKASSVSATGMTWHLDAWADTILYSAGASYIALS